MARWASELAEAIESGSRRRRSSRCSSCQRFGETPTSRAYRRRAVRSDSASRQNEIAVARDRICISSQMPRTSKALSSSVAESRDSRRAPASCPMSSVKRIGGRPSPGGSGPKSAVASQGSNRAPIRRRAPSDLAYLGALCSGVTQLCSKRCSTPWGSARHQCNPCRLTTNSTYGFGSPALRAPSSSNSHNSLTTASQAPGGCRVRKRIPIASRAGGRLASGANPGQPSLTKHPLKPPHRRGVQAHHHMRPTFGVSLAARDPAVLIQPRQRIAL